MIEVIVWCIIVFTLLLAVLAFLVRKRSNPSNDSQVDYRAIERQERNRQMREWQQEYNKLLGIEPLTFERQDHLITNTLALKRSLKTRRDYDNERYWHDH